MSVISRFLPPKSNFAMHQAAMRPNAALIGTTITATNSVRRIEWSASGSTSEARYSSHPLLNASTATTISGASRKSARKPMVNAVRIHRVGAASVVIGALARAGSATSAIAVAPAGPGLCCVDREQHDERDRQLDRRDRGRSGVIVFLELDDDQKRRDLGDERHVAGDEDDRAIFPDAAREGQRNAGEQRRRQLRDHHAADRLPSARSERRRSLLLADVERADDRLDRAHDERKADEDQRNQDAPGGVGDLHAEMRQNRADPAVRSVEGRERNARDGGRQGERKVDHGVEQAPAWKRIPGQSPSDREAGEEIDKRRQDRHAERHAKRLE